MRSAPIALVAVLHQVLTRLKDDRGLAALKGTRITPACRFAIPAVL